MTRQNYNCKLQLQTTIVVFAIGGIFMSKISEAELEIMKVVWNKKSATSLEIIEEVSKQTKWSKNTIKTLISRLVEKEALKVIKNKGNLYIYQPIISENTYKKSENQNFLNKLYNGSINDMLLSFVKAKKLTKKDLEELMNIIEEDE